MIGTFFLTLEALLGVSKSEQEHLQRPEFIQLSQHCLTFVLPEVGATLAMNLVGDDDAELGERVEGAWTG